MDLVMKVDGIINCNYFDKTSDAKTFGNTNLCLNYNF